MKFRLTYPGFIAELADSGHGKGTDPGAGNS